MKSTEGGHGARRYVFVLQSANSVLIVTIESFRAVSHVFPEAAVRAKDRDFDGTRLDAFEIVVERWARVDRSALECIGCAHQAWGAIDVDSARAADVLRRTARGCMRGALALIAEP